MKLAGGEKKQNSFFKSRAGRTYNRDLDTDRDWPQLQGGNPFDRLSFNHLKIAIDRNTSGYFRFISFTFECYD